jgi:hypothetical protein
LGDYTVGHLGMGRIRVRKVTGWRE